MLSGWLAHVTARAGVACAGDHAEWQAFWPFARSISRMRIIWCGADVGELHLGESVIEELLGISPTRESGKRARHDLLHAIAAARAGLAALRMQPGCGTRDQWRRPEAQFHPMHQGVDG